jgi:hypothetical protein
MRGVGILPDEPQRDAKGCGGRRREHALHETDPADRQGPISYGIGEWYGTLVETLTKQERDRLARAASAASSDVPNCPFRDNDPHARKCGKRGGVCTMRAYGPQTDGGVAAASGLVTICPERFEEGGLAKRWVGETLLGCSNPAVVTEVDFLRRPEPLNAEADAAGGAADRAVGRIDCVLVDPAHLNPLS